MKKQKPKYFPKDIEVKWQKKWEETNVYQPDMDAAKKPFYNLMMFPYPSAEGMHVGNMYAFTGSDIYGRFKRMQGYYVFEPIGLDGFGIHSENYAIKVGRHPKEQAKVSQANFYRQLKATGNAFDWSRTLQTYDPTYYKWTQWIFTKLFEKGIAYKKIAEVNFCPSCKTVLADEQVIDGKCERCSSEVTKKALEQWFFRITKYADRLSANIEGLNWTEKVKIAQRQWIGKSDGARIKFSLQVPGQPENKHGVEVFTTRPDTLYGATFLVISPEVGKKWLDVGWKAPKEVVSYITKSLKKDQVARTDDKKEKTGVFTEVTGTNPVNGKDIPVWVADYVLGGYGTGAIMAVPAHDQRDFEFASKFSLPILEVIASTDGVREKAYTGEGELINSGDWNGMQVPDAIGKIIDLLEKQGIGKKETTYHLRDWLISRQRYWGPPIPMIFCERCEWQPVAEKDLPVLLPDVKDWKPKGEGTSPLANMKDFVHTICPKCGGKADRETDVSDTFLDSSWYFFRYISTEDEKQAWEEKRAKKWLPVTMYIGGAEHSVLHLLYSRFLTMVFKDLGLCDFEEPFSRFYAHGLLIKDGAKMSKSKGNVVIPDEYIGKYGADTLRTYLMFSGPFDQGGDFRDTAIEGMYKFMRKVWTLSHESTEKGKESTELTRAMHKAIKQVLEDMERLHYNTAIAHIMEYYNVLAKQEEVNRNYVKTLLLLLAPFAPHIAEELWEVIGEPFSIHTAMQPSYDATKLIEDTVTIVVQINGKMRDDMKVGREEAKEQKAIEQLARNSEKAKRFLEGKTIKKVIYIPEKIINFVVSE